MTCDSSPWPFPFFLFVGLRRFQSVSYEEDSSLLTRRSESAVLGRDNSSSDSVIPNTEVTTEEVRARITPATMPTKAADANLSVLITRADCESKSRRGGLTKVYSGWEFKLAGMYRRAKG